MKKTARQHCCEEMERHLSAHDVPLEYWPKFREYGLRVVDGGSAVQLLAYCPWCGQKLPSSLRDRWINRLDELGLEPGDANIPPSLLTDAWWRKSKSGKVAEVGLKRRNGR